MMRQAESGDTSELPKILPALATTILKLQGQKSEGIFRVPGDAEGVSGILILFRITM
jgi:hypothetical protein